MATANKAMFAIPMMTKHNLGLVSHISHVGGIADG